MPADIHFNIESLQDHLCPDLRDIANEIEDIDPSEHFTDVDTEALADRLIDVMNQLQELYEGLVSGEEKTKKALEKKE